MNAQQACYIHFLGLISLLLVLGSCEVPRVATLRTGTPNTGTEGAVTRTTYLEDTPDAAFVPEQRSKQDPSVLKLIHTRSVERRDDIPLLAGFKNGPQTKKRRRRTCPNPQASCVAYGSDF